MTRFWFLRVIGFTYFFAFLSALNQVIPLLGETGLTPASRVVADTVTLAGFIDLPTVFWFAHSDAALYAVAVIGVVLSVAVTAGFANVPVMITLWFTYLSFVNVGQVWYGYGWEMQLVETGLLAVFMVPLLDPRPFKTRPPKLIIWLLRWLTVRVNLGSGLIKLRGVSCWTDLTCLNRFFQTQPIPNPASPYMHYLHPWLQKLGVAYTHFVQLIAPIGAVFEATWRNVRITAGVLLASLQLLLILTGNFAILNWVTLAATISFFDDDFLKSITPSFIVRKAEAAKEEIQGSSGRLAVNIAVTLIIAALSIPVVLNLASAGQAMNASYNDWHVVNTYGAFGSVREQRTELIMQGTTASNLSQADWKTYDIPAKPDRVNESLPVVAPYQPRLAWQFWFASMSTPQREPWLIHLVWDELNGDNETQRLLNDPFLDENPSYIRIVKYRYELQHPVRNDTWRREPIGTWLPPVSKENDQIPGYLDRLRLQTREQPP